MPDILPAFQIGAPLRAGAVTIFPVFAPPSARVDYRLAADAFADGSFEIHEATQTAGRPMVGMLEARNRSRDRVLIVEGDHLVGAKQNRMLTSSALIGGAQCVPLPASCVEQGRWEGRSEQFSRSATMAPASLRRIAKLSVTRSMLGNGGRGADQQRIWSTIADQQRRLSVSSATRSLAHTFAERAPDVGRATARLGYVDGAIGIAIGLANELISVDAFDSPATCAHYWHRLVEGAALEGLARRQNDDRVLAPADVEALLARAGVGAWRAVAPVGDGEELRANLDGDVGAAASLLRLDGRLVHFGVVTGTVAPVHSPREHPRMLRRDLPDELARRYRIVDRIGAGGSKEVFRATVIAGGPDVAIARMPYVDDLQFAGELEAIRRVDSAYVPRIHESLIDEHGDGYIVMERCDGPNLATIVGRGALAMADATPILLAFARGLREIHEAHVLHRDVKLENAMLSTANDQVELKIVDFGLSARAGASATDVGVVRFGGTLPYMSREMLRGQPLDARSDVYAFGVCCYRMLVGEFPIPPTDHESDFDYMRRLSLLSHHDFSALPTMPSPVRSILIRMLDLEREHRPLMPEVVAVFERAFGNPQLRIPQRTQPIKPRTPRPSLVRTAAVHAPIESPEHVLVTADMQSPIVVLSPLGTHPTSGPATAVGGYNARGQLSWAHELPGSYAAGLRADLDGDGMREIYLAGPDSVALLGASGRVKYTRSVPAYATRPTLIAIPDRTRPRLVIDGHLIEPATGADLGMLPYTYQGNGSALVATDDRRGIAYNGFALQAFRGWHGTAPAIINHAGANSFLVAHLEESRSATPRVQLVVYGPGGSMRHMLHVADGQLATGDTAEISRLRNAPLFPASCSPVGLLSADGRAVVIVPLLGADRALPALLAAYELPTGRLLWRTELPGVIDGRAILADVDGDGRPELVVGDGNSITAYDPWTGTASEPIACRGYPVAFGDPFASGFNHLFVVVAGGVELWRGPSATAPGTMQWCGARGDLWRTGTLGADGKPLGPL